MVDPFPVISTYRLSGHMGEFKLAFRGHHIPLGLMRMKEAKFMRLTQGTKTLTEYMHAFNNLSRYALGFVDTEEKKN